MSPLGVVLIVAGLVGATVGPAMAQLASEDLDPVMREISEYVGNVSKSVF